MHPGDLLAEFDRTNELKLAREAQAKYDDLSHQVDQKRAEHKSNAEKRTSDLEQAQADLEKAQIEIRKGPILSEIDQKKNAVKLEDAKEHVASLERSNHFHDVAEAAEIRILELQRDRQKIALARQESNAQKLSLRAPIGGMVALQNVFRNIPWDTPKRAISCGREVRFSNSSIRRRWWLSYRWANRMERCWFREPKR